MNLKFNFTSLSIICFVFVLSCGTPATKITGSWKDPKAESYKDFFIAVLSKNQQVRQQLEGDIANRLKKTHVKVTRSLEVFPHTEKVETPEEKKAAIEKIKALGHEAIMVIKLVNKTEDTRYVAGTNSYAPTNIGIGTGYNLQTTGAPPPGQYGAFGMYYLDNYGSHTTPGYYQMDQAYFLESNLFDTKTEKLVWSAQSEVFNPANLPSASGDFSFVMVDALKKGNLIYKDEKRK
ncbi:MAG TPA: hypothetical protein VGQ59_18105 [Cyclobacteriaceae bacterium]|jgi:hypothetical protein|nr:hypothetical protein [Cyclobacteriaceae bacterium]